MNGPRQDITGKIVFLSGASGGIGAELIRAFCDAGAAEIIAASRHPIVSDRGQVRPYKLDVTADAEVAEAGRQFADRTHILVNCSGVNSNSRIFAPPSLAEARQEMEVNYFGLLNMVRAFAPAMKARKSGTIVNMLSMVSLVNIPLMGSYCASKAAAWSLTQAMRAELRPHGVHVCAMFPSATETAMTAHLSIPKLKPAMVADAVIDAIRDGTEDAQEGLIHDHVVTGLRTDPKAVERQMAARLGPTP
jgi:NAD(P)-dependent dehydrogenase (short-subunit alcohol dehydrogenase family)